MREPLILSPLGVNASQPDRVFALGAESHLTWAQWQTKVADWAWTLSQFDAERVGLYFDDAVALSAALWGAWHAGKTPCLLADALPASLQRLAAQNLALAGDLPDAIQVEPNQGATKRAPLCADDAQVELFTSGSTGEPVAIRKSLRQLEAEVQALETQFGAGSARFACSARSPPNIFTGCYSAFFGPPQRVDRSLRSACSIQNKSPPRSRLS